jgi:hypothetical protein
VGWLFSIIGGPGVATVVRYSEANLGWRPHAVANGHARTTMVLQEKASPIRVVSASVNPSFVYLLYCLPRV